MIRVIAVVCSLAASASAAPFDKALAPPRAFDGLRAGVALADAKATLAEWELDSAYRDAAQRTRFVKDAGDGARFYVLVSDATISRIGVEAPKAGLVEKLTALWGKPARAMNLAAEALTSWSGNGWRADLACREGLCRLAYHQPLDAAYFGNAVAPPAVLGGLKPWMQRAEIEKLLPRFAHGEIPAGREDVRIALDLDREGRLRSVLVAGMPDTARAVLEQAWGPRDASGTWWNPQGGWRAKLDEDLHSLQLFPYVPAARLFGAGPTIAALPKPILGATRDKLAAAYPALALPPIEDGLGPTSVAVTFDRKGIATKLAITLPFATQARRDELVKLFAAKWGSATQTGQTYVFPTRTPKIEAVERAGSLVLQLSL